MTSQAEREENWEALRARVAQELDGLGDVMVVGWKYPEGELIVVGTGVDLLGTLVGAVVGPARAEIRIRLTEDGTLP